MKLCVDCLRPVASTPCARIGVAQQWYESISTLFATIFFSFLFFSSICTQTRRWLSLRMARPFLGASFHQMTLTVFQYSNPKLTATCKITDKKSFTIRPWFAIRAARIFLAIVCLPWARKRSLRTFAFFLGSPWLTSWVKRSGRRTVIFSLVWRFLRRNNRFNLLSSNLLQRSHGQE